MEKHIAATEVTIMEFETVIIGKINNINEKVPFINTNIRKGKTFEKISLS